MIEAGIRCVHSLMMDEDDIWSRYSNDKTGIGEHLASVIRTLSASLPLNRKLRAPLHRVEQRTAQFRILEIAFKDSLYLHGIDPQAQGFALSHENGLIPIVYCHWNQPTDFADYARDSPLTSRSGMSILLRKARETLPKSRRANRL